MEGNGKNRESGEIGIHITIHEATPLASEQKQHGSGQYFMMAIGDMLGAALQQVPLHKIKGVFERRNMLQGVFFSRITSGAVLMADFEQIEGLDHLWTAYKKGSLGPFLQEVLATPGVMKELKSKLLKLKVTMHEEEYNTCRTELLAKQMKAIIITDNEPDREMVQVVKDYQGALTEKILTMRDELAKFDQNMGEFLMILKQQLPDNIQQIATFKQFDEIQKLIRKSSKLNMKPLDYYITAHQSSRKLLEDMEAKICHPLALVHASCETTPQREHKKMMKEKCLDMQRRLKPECSFIKLKHSDVQSKILLREQALFLGLVSVLHFAVETIVDIDHLLDEYLSAVDFSLN